MKTMFSVLLIYLSTASVGQNFITEKIGGKEYEKVLLSNGLIIYQPLGENNDNYIFASRYVIRYDSLMSIGYLKSYDYDHHFIRKKMVDTLFFDSITALFRKRQDINNRVWILFGMKDKNEEFIAVLFVFKKKQFRKFAEKSSKLVRVKGISGTGEELKSYVYDYKKYAQEFVLAKLNDNLVLLKVKAT